MLLAALLAVGAGHVAAARATPWPLAPQTVRPPIRAGFLDFRSSSHGRIWHLGADLDAYELPCNPLAPPTGCLRVFAILGGHVWARYPTAANACGIVRVGMYGYGHMIGRVRLGQHVQTGQFIGWSCRHEWHIHMTRFYQYPCGILNGRVGAPDCRQTDPLARGRIMADPNDTTGPVLRSWAIVNGYLDARIEDASHAGWAVPPWSRMVNDLPPARIVVNGRTLISSTMWPLPPVSSVYAPEATRNRGAKVCAETWPPLVTCAGRDWFRLGIFSPGTIVTVNAWDSEQNETTTVIDVP